MSPGYREKTYGIGIGFIRGIKQKNEINRNLCRCSSRLRPQKCGFSLSRIFLYSCVVDTVKCILNENFTKR